MFSRPTVWLIFAALFAAVSLCAEEQNVWPVSVRQLGPGGTPVSGEYLGPLLFYKTSADGAKIEGFRPLYLHVEADGKESSYFAYPLFTWETGPGYRAFSFFQLFNRRRSMEPGQPEVRGFDAWPLYFSKETGDPATTYHALFPFGGTIKQRLGYDRIHFVLFPCYLQTEQAGARVTHAPWPFLRFIDGADHHGFEFWPLFGRRGRAGDYDSRFYLWPLAYKSSRHLSDPQPEEKLGVLPFYTRDTGPGLISENYVWPLFGYTHRTEPYRYDERRYLWPFLVQGKGDQRSVNRWAPLYTHSVIKGYDKTWFIWPLVRHARWTESGLNQEQNQVLWFLYWSLTQSSATNPAAAPGHKTHLWPLFSSWDNGAGRRQVQLLSPFEVFFPTNEPMRQLYSPLFALYRYDRRAPGDVRGSVLFSLVSWKKSAAEGEFHLGPLAWRRTGATGWKFSVFDFPRKAINKATTATPP